MSGALPPDPTPRRVRFEPLKLGGRARSAGLMVYGAVAIIMAVIAVYMAAVAGYPLGSIQVAGPAIGALWFGLRVFMLLASREK